MKSLFAIIGPIAFLWIGCHHSGDGYISFNEDIRPILNEKCLRCHGGVKANGGFSLLFEEDAFGETESGKPAIVPGHHQRSELYQRLVHTNAEMRMPLDAQPLTPDEIDLIADWIDQGAKWEKHWAYVPPARDIVPPPSNDDWVQNEIDHFVLAKLTEKDLRPSKEAGKEILVRRLYLDATGLPPTGEERQLFLNDASPQAYEKLVDRVLASPHYGERWAAMWLDLARYADTKGYEKDSNRNIWKYRDWVINAFNQDMPFDQFSVEQLAGDLLQNPTESQLIATAFHRNSIANDEGGTNDEEFRVASVIDRVSTTYEVWQGTTMACVQCHSHPYDPFRHKEFYTSMAYFNNSIDRDIYNEQPKLHSYAPADSVKVSEIMEYIKETLKPVDQIAERPFLYEEKETLLDNLGYHVTEAEEYAQSSRLIELIWPNLDMLWQVQDSSWIRFDDVDLTDIEEIGFRAATILRYAGDISVHLDSLNGPEVGRVKITKTGDWDRWQSSRPVDENDFKEFKTKIKGVQGVHRVYLRFWVGDTFIQHLFYLDKIFYYEENPRYASYDQNLKQQLVAMDEIGTTTTPIIRELPADQSRKTHLFDRGSWLMPGEEVSPGIPGVYGVDSTKHLEDRLAFARWLVSRENPLAARVVVNRFWEQLFGFGIVESMEEFGTQGAPPTHPELLDWLAVRFMDTHDWKMKPLLRELLLSATYRQSSDADSVKIEKDPLNQWLSRGARTRLTSEQIRDQILAVSGLLDRTIGGPSMILPELNISASDIPNWTGDNTYRRSLYTFWKRTDPFPSMITFDSPDRTVCTSRRIRTNTPLQALNLLNDLTYFEASRALASVVLGEKEYLDDQLSLCYQMITGSSIEPKKLNLLKELYQDSYTHYEDTNVGLCRDRECQLSALTLVASAMLNLDEVVVKG